MGHTASKMTAGAPTPVSPMPDSHHASLNPMSRPTSRAGQLLTPLPEAPATVIEHSRVYRFTSNVFEQVVEAEQSSRSIMAVALKGTRPRKYRGLSPRRPTGPHSQAVQQRQMSPGRRDQRRSVSHELREASARSEGSDAARGSEPRHVLIGRGPGPSNVFESEWATRETARTERRVRTIQLPGPSLAAPSSRSQRQEDGS